MITITDKAIKAIREKTALKEGAVGLRLNIKSTGCSGNSYKMEYATEEDLKVDDKFEQDGAVLYVPKMRGSELGLLDDGLTLSQTSFDQLAA